MRPWLEHVVDLFVARQVQPPPAPSSAPPVWDLVRADIGFGPADGWAAASEAVARARDELGLARYATRLQPLNGRDMLADHLQERLDGLAYLRATIYELETGARGPLGSLALYTLRPVYAADLRTFRQVFQVWAMLEASCVDG